MSNISTRRHDKHLNIWGNQNVLDGEKNASTDPIQTPSCLYLALNNLVLSRPNWQFIITGSEGFVISSAEKYRMIKSVTISEDGENLGFIDIRWKASDMKLYVQNERISAKRERQYGYFTEDPAKAELAIRKHFYRLAKPERIKKALEVANSVISNTAHNKLWDMNRASTAFMEHSEQFVEKHMDLYMQAFPQHVQTHEKFAAAKAEHQVAEHVEKLFDNGKTLTVVLDGEQYVVVEGKDAAPKTYTDATLTFDMRKKIGMLKLVEGGQMISGIGCRVDDSTFVLLPEDNTKEQE